MKWFRAKHDENSGDATQPGDKYHKVGPFSSSADDYTGLRAEMLPASQAAPERWNLFGWLRLFSPLRLALGLVFLLLVFLGWLFYAGPGRPVLEKLLVSLASWPTPTITQVAALTPTPVISTATRIPVKASAILTPTSTHTLLIPSETPTVTITPAPDNGCLDATSITLADVGKTVCVRGIILRVEQKPNGFLIVFSDQKGAFYWISYDLVWKQAKEGLCVQTSGEIKQLGNSPVLIFGYSNLPEVCASP